MALDYASSRSAARQRRRELAVPVSLVRRLDWILLAATVALMGYGLWIISGVTHGDVTGDPNHFLIRQGVFMAVGAVGFVAMLVVDPAFFRRYKHVLYATTLGAMILVFLAGTAARGSKRWIDLSFFRLQPSEFGKLFFVLFLAGFLADRGKRVGEMRTLLQAVGLAIVPVGLVFLQPDFGTALVYTAALMAVLFVAGTRWLHLGILAGLAVGLAVAVLWALPAAGLPVLKSYQQQRITGFLHPNSDPQGATYNQAQATIAVGAGGIHGRGVSGATQTNLSFLPEHATDFVFASLAEQRGFLGAAVLLLLYLLVVWRGLKVITVARDSFSAIAAGGIVLAFLFQVFVNVGMTIGIAPITGIPVPFVSVGGSSMVANLLALGMLQAIYARGRARG